MLSQGVSAHWHDPGTWDLGPGGLSNAFLAWGMAKALHSPLW